MPRFIKKLPHDLISGKPMRYRAAGDGTFLLYSVAWNQQDDGGAIAAEPEKGDWVWVMAKKLKKDR